MPLAKLLARCEPHVYELPAFCIFAAAFASWLAFPLVAPTPEPIPLANQLSDPGESAV